MSRTAALRKALGWPQHQLAEWLCVSQPTVSNLENGQAESGPTRRLLDQLAREHGLFDLASDVWPGAPVATGEAVAPPVDPSPAVGGAA
mgnify:CR=1 FL=1